MELPIANIILIADTIQFSRFTAYSSEAFNHYWLAVCLTISSFSAGLCSHPFPNAIHTQISHISDLESQLHTFSRFVITPIP